MIRRLLLALALLGCIAGAVTLARSVRETEGGAP